MVKVLRRLLVGLMLNDSNMFQYLTLFRVRPCHVNVYGLTFIIWLVIVEWSGHWPICDILVFSQTLDFFTYILNKWQFSIKTPFQASFIEWRLVFSFSFKVKILIKAAKHTSTDMISEFGHTELGQAIQPICISGT